MKIFPNSLLFIIGGFLAGVLSLVTLAIIPQDLLPPTSFPLILNVIIEEIIKIALIWFIITNFTNFDKSTKIISHWQGVLFGVGFTLLEIILRNINNLSLLINNALAVLFIHIITSVLLTFSVYDYQKSKKLSTKSITYLVLAIFIHLCYNLIIQVVF